MKRWEYRIARADSQLRSLNDLGRDGWEAFGVIGDGDVYMRRPLFLCARSTCGHRFDAHSSFRGHLCRHPSCNCPSFVFDSDPGQ